MVVDRLPPDAGLTDLGTHQLLRQSLTGITGVEDDATTTITYVQSRIVALSQRRWAGGRFAHAAASLGQRR